MSAPTYPVSCPSAGFFNLFLFSCGSPCFLAFLPEQLSVMFSLFIGVQLPGGYCGMIPDFHLPSLFTGSCNVISCVREEETVSFPFKPDRAVIVQHIKDDHVPSIFLEAFDPRQVMPL